MIYLKRFLPFILSFSIIITFFVRPFSAEAVVYPVFRFDNSYITSDDTINLHGYPWAYILSYNQSINTYSFICISLPVNELDKSAINLTYDSSHGYFSIFNQFTNGLFCIADSRSSVSNSVSYIDFSMTSTSSYFSFSTNNFIFGYVFDNSPEINIQSGGYTVLASNVDLVYNGTVLHAGSQAELESYFDSSALPKFFSSDSSGTVSTGSGDNSAKQVQISNNILTNIKSIISSILNLPSRIADSVSSFFSDVKNGIVNALYSVRDSIIQGLKDLFVPSSDVFDGIKNEFSSRFGFIYQIKDLAFSLLSIDSGSGIPDFSFTIYGLTVNAIDFSWIDNYITLIHGIILVFSWIPFLIRLYRRIPSIIFMYKGDNG